MEGEQPTLPGGIKQWQAALLLAGVLCLGLGVFLWITAKRVPPVVEVISGGSGSETGSGSEITVDVEGAVNEPGLYTLTANERIEAALTAAGGISSEADVEWLEKNINRADKLKDGMKIYIPKITSTLITAGGRGVVMDSCVSLNEGSQSQLEELPGVGPVTAGKIISGRPYSQITDLKDKKIVGEKLFTEIEGKVCLW